MKALELKVYESVDGKYWVNGLGWSPRMIDNTARAKRFTDAELAAECWRTEASAYRAMVLRGGKVDRRAEARSQTMARFATLPHCDEQS